MAGGWRLRFRVRRMAEESRRCRWCSRENPPPTHLCAQKPVAETVDQNYADTAEDKTRLVYLSALEIREAYKDAARRDEGMRRLDVALKILEWYERRD